MVTVVFFEFRIATYLELATLDLYKALPQMQILFL